MTPSKRPSCAYIVSRYPSLTHTFILREVFALRERGLEIVTATVRRSPDTAQLSPSDQTEARDTYGILPASPGRILRAHAEAFRHAPRAYLSTLLETLRDAPAGPRAQLWQLFYFVEAMIFWSWLHSHGIRHVHAHHANVGADLAMVATRFANRAGAGMTWSLTMHGPTEFRDIPGHKLELKISRADAVIAISDFVRAQLLSLTDNPVQTEIRTIHCGVDPSEYETGNNGRPTDRPLQILSVARLAPRKGQEVLVEAVSQLLAEDIATELTIVGDGPSRGDVERRAHELGVSDAVTLAGARGQDEMAAFYSAADVFCLPSFAEGLPIVLMEAMASEVPVVATGIMGVPELVEEGCGLLVPPARADLLAEALARLDRDPELRRRLAKAGREKVLADFSLHDSAAALEEVFRRLMSPADMSATTETSAIR